MKIKRLRDLREDRDLFQKDIARILKISQQYYSEYENGNRRMPIEYLVELAKFYNVSLDYILGLTDDTKPHRKKQS